MCVCGRVCVCGKNELGDVVGWVCAHVCMCVCVCVHDELEAVYVCGGGRGLYIPLL